jgi:lipopolysaccharide export LptBFGC system permease protein LptF
MGAPRITVLERYLVGAWLSSWSAIFCATTILWMVGTIFTFHLKYRAFIAVPIFHLLPSLLAYSIPIALPLSILLATAVTFARLAEDGELHAIAMGGKPLRRWILLLALVAVLPGTAALGLFNGVFAPAARWRLYSFFRRIPSSAFALEKVAVKDLVLKDCTITARNGRSGELASIEVARMGSGGRWDLLVGRSISAGTSTRSVELRDGEFLALDGRARRIVQGFRFAALDLPLPGLEEAKTDRLGTLSAKNLTDRELGMSLQEIRTILFRLGRPMTDGVGLAAGFRAERFCRWSDDLWVAIAFLLGSAVGVRGRTLGLEMAVAVAGGAFFAAFVPVQALAGSSGAGAPLALAISIVLAVSLGAAAWWRSGA